MLFGDGADDAEERDRDDRGRAAVSAADTLRAGGAELRGVVVV